MSDPPVNLILAGFWKLIQPFKNCEDKFEEVALSPRFNFVGNIDLGNDLPLAALKPHYDAILFAYGASQDRELGIPGENVHRSVYSARSFVGWYNGLPEHRDLEPNLTSGEDAVIVGQGNVALDVARILLSGVDALKHTDITDYALETLSKSRIRRVRVVGRRGPLQVNSSRLKDHGKSLISFFSRLHLLSKKSASSFNSPMLLSTPSQMMCFLPMRLSLDYPGLRSDLCNFLPKAQSMILPRLLNLGRWISCSLPTLFTTRPRTRPI